MTTPEYGQPTPAPKSKAKGCAGIGCGLVVLLVVIIGIATAISSKSTPTASSPAPATGASSQAAAPATTKAAPASNGFSGDGEYQVGTDIKPGTYKSGGPGSSGMCYWERDKDALGSADSIIANDTPTGSSVVTIKATDKIFKTQGCKDWTKIG